MPHQVKESAVLINMFKVPAKIKLIDEDAARTLEEKREQLKQSYRPEQGWLLDEQNKVERRVA